LDQRLAFSRAAPGDFFSPHEVRSDHSQMRC